MRSEQKKSTSPERKEARKRMIWPLIIIVVFTVVRLVQGGGHSVGSNIDDRMLGLSVDSYATIFIALDDIQSVDLVEEIGVWELLDGSGDEKYIFGTCSTERYGNARVCAYLNAHSYIVLELSQETFIYNLSTTKKTEENFNKLLKAINV